MARKQRMGRFFSKKQWAWAFATKQPWARRHARNTPGGRKVRYRKLPKYSTKKKNRRRGR